jgi:flagellar biogenesis protein FliO
MFDQNKSQARMIDHRPHHRSLVYATACVAAFVGQQLLAPRPLQAAPPTDNGIAAGRAASGSIRQTTHTASSNAPPYIDRGAAASPRNGMAPGAAPRDVEPGEKKIRLGAAESPVSNQSTPSARGASHGLKALTSLAVVLGLFLAVVWVMRRSTPQASRRLPAEVVEVLGHTTLGHRQQAQLVRLGKRLLLIAVSPAGAETLAEVTDVAEVDRLATLCRGSNVGGANPSFRDVLQHFKERSSTARATKAQMALGLHASVRPEEHDV